MLEVILLLILWAAVSIICVNDLNEKLDPDNEWSTLPIVGKAIVYTVAPLAYIFIEIDPAIKK